MNEEISRILELLEKGTISAEEAERLIRVAGEAGTTGWARSTAAEVPPVMDVHTAEQEARHHADRAIEDFWDPFSPFSNPMLEFRDLSKTFRRIRERIRRHNTRRFWWNYFRLNRWYEDRREQRKQLMTTYDRVRFVLLIAPSASDFILQPQTVIAELLDRDRIGWDLLKLGLEEEFGLDVSMDLVLGFRTVQDVVDWVDRHQPAADAAESTAPDTEHSDTASSTEAEGEAEPSPPAEKPSRRKGAAGPIPDAAD